VSEARRSRLRRLLGAPFVFIAAILFLFEEILWTAFTRLLGRLARIGLVARLEAWAARLPPYAAMALFLVPLALIVPVKLVALWLIGTHHVVTGVALLVAAKLAATAIEARLFAVCKPALLSVGWFRRLHDWVLGVRARLYARLAAMPAWQAARRRGAALRALIAETGRWLKDRLSRYQKRDAPAQPGENQ
jgi:hypothetical protein